MKDSYKNEFFLFGIIGGILGSTIGVTIGTIAQIKGGSPWSPGRGALLGTIIGALGLGGGVVLYDALKPKGPKPDAEYMRSVVEEEPG